VNFLFIEHARLRGVNRQHAERPLVALNDHRYAADHPVFHQQCLGLKARFRAQVRHHRRFAGQQREAGLRTHAASSFTSPTAPSFQPVPARNSK